MAFGLSAIGWTMTVVHARGLGAWGFLLMPAVWGLHAVAGGFALRPAWAALGVAVSILLGSLLVALRRTVEVEELAGMVLSTIFLLVAVRSAFRYRRRAIREELGADVGPQAAKLLALSAMWRPRWLRHRS
jgi:hypothetical protein